MEHHSYSLNDDDYDTDFTVRRNGKVFYIKVSPPHFINSDVTKRKYLSYVELLKSGEEVLGDIYESDVYEWLLPPFDPFLTELAPDPHDPANTKVTLQ